MAKSVECDYHNATDGVAIHNCCKSAIAHYEWNEHYYSERRCGRHYENVLVLWAKRWWRRRHQSVNGQTPRQ